MIKSKTRNRSGITLLFVISMIVLFLLMGTSFVVMTTQFRRTSDSRARMQTRRDSAPTLVNRALYDLLRGPTLDNVFSPLRGMSILGDQYGYGVKANVVTASFVDPLVAASGNQFLILELDSNVGIAGHQFFPTYTTSNDPTDPANHLDFSDQGGAYDGHVLTFTSGPGRGVSARIVSYVVSLDATGNVLNRQFVLMPDWEDQDSAFAVANAVFLTNSEVLINGRDFGGTGAGFYDDFADPNLAALSDQALLPNRVGEARTTLLNDYLGRTGGVNFAAPNENYDAVDFQNMFLAAIRNEDGDGVIDPLGIIPSFHQQSLLDYHLAQTGVIPDRAVFRVSGTSNGGGPDFPTPDASDPPEVDNDLDGINDGVWLDIGLPLQTDMEGRVYKPLVSYLVVDMDGKFNVNAHGNETDLDPATGNAYVSVRAPMLGVATIANHRGQGYGPAEINIGNLFGIGAGSDYSFLLRGGATAFTGTTLTGRYGNDGVPGRPERDAASINKWYSHPTGTLGGYFGTPMDAMGRFGIGVTSFTTPSLSSDPYDATSAAFNVPIGFPIIDAVTSTWGTTPFLGLGTEIANAPYEMSFRNDSLMPAGAADHPFSPREMERVLRIYDPDAVMLPSRLRDFTRATLDPTGAGASARMAFSHASYEVPLAPENLVVGLRQALVATRGLDLDGDNIVDDALENIFLEFQVASMLSPDLMKGLRMDVNRPFGNGADDDGDNVTDESWHPDSTGALDPVLNESQVGEGLIQADSASTTAATTFDHDNDGFAAGDPDAHLAHQAFARHLYILTLLTTERVDRTGDGAIIVGDDWYDYDNSGGVTNDDWIAYRRDVAQWAINVANFRDRDSARQPFEVDLEPWDGWHVNGILDSDELLPSGDPDEGYFGAVGSPSAPDSVEFPATTEVFWGVERPEMVMSEVLVLHDRRTEDLDTDDNLGDFSTDSGGTDPTLDSSLVPNASFFLELYNPWIVSDDATIANNNSRFPAEFYDATATGIDLQQTAPDGSPVWQVLVIHTDPNNLAVNPDDGTLDEDQILRRIYFTKPDPTVDALEFGTNKVYFPDSGIASAPLEPGRYAVAGSSGIQDGDRYHTYLGRRSTPTWDMELEDNSDETRRITLDTDNSALEINYFDPSGAGSWNVLTRPAIVLPIGRQEDGTAAGKARSIGVTDPTDGYDVELTNAGLGYQLNAVADGFQLVDAALMPVVHDEPLDSAYGLDFDNLPTDTVAAEWGALQEDGMHNTDQLLRIVHLRCLANPQAPYDPLLNPYLTVDSLGTPVNSFNGVSNSSEVGASSANMAFASRERGANDADLARDRLFWRADQNGIITPVDLVALTDSHFHSLNLDNSLAELDVAYRNASTSAFPWLTWNNRPFVSHLELANVPFTSSYWLLSRMDYVDGVFAEEYDPSSIVIGGGDPNRDMFAGRFKHLPGIHADSATSPGLYRTMDYLEVPSRFVGTETFLNPAVFAAAGNTMGFNPPFNKISNYRNPGKINLNTVFDSRVWDGLMRNYNIDVSYAAFNVSRSGIGATPTDFPTQFGAPFRAARSANMVPTLASADPNAMVAGRNGGGVDALGSETGLFRRALPGTEIPLLDVATIPGPYADPDRNAYFRYDMRQRMGNLVTNRSSVFSIWITIGFFEVDADLNVGAEVGSDSGEVQRYRGFYMVDRSIPVGFEPGFNHNVDQAILTSSITERAITRD